ncbi:class E sortase [Streptomyces sp. CB03238]|uniref:class E sortase n=1 Tax=Streptomyces sp. CB03238 TaxID=1907777 RepID=UPI000A1217C3|nr:class E sortase [Streptomyces sp. CB03238]ORT61583.1 class E sortase [Streptomyces sp. CB03238]
MRTRIPVVVRQRRRGWPGAFARGVWVAGELAVTVGVVLLLLVVHQFWWTNQQARAGAQRQVQVLEREWAGVGGGVERGVPGEPAAEGGPAASEAPGAPAPPAAPGASAAVPSPDAREPRPAYAVLRIPALRLSVPVARGIAKRGVLDKGYAGHYPGTAPPGQPGNFALAGHRNTHGEPFRYINRLRKGDEIVVETRDGVFTYVVDRMLARTSPRDTATIAPVPKGYDQPGYYVTLTTCTPEYSSTYRLIVWGKLHSMRPR